MSKALIEKLRRAREQKVAVNGHSYTIRRPTDLEAMAFDQAGGSTAEMAQKFVVGWELIELDLVPGGGPEPVPFDPELWAEYVADHPDVWTVLAGAIREAYKAHLASREVDEKN